MPLKSIPVRRPRVRKFVSTPRYQSPGKTNWMALPSKHKDDQFAVGAQAEIWWQWNLMKGILR
ncbi:hypothetical protein ACLK2A_20330 [Escherichia coli]